MPKVKVNLPFKVGDKVSSYGELQALGEIKEIKYDIDICGGVVAYFVEWDNETESGWYDYNDLFLRSVYATELELPFGVGDRVFYRDTSDFTDNKDIGSITDVALDVEGRIQYLVIWDTTDEDMEGGDWCLIPLLA